MIGPNDDEAELLRQFAENFDAFRDAVMETIKVFHGEQKLFKVRLAKMDEHITHQGYLLWLILATCGVGLAAFLISLLSR